MRILFACFIVVLIISGKQATPIEQTDIIEASGETENLSKDEGVKSEENNLAKQLDSDNEMPIEVIEEPVKRAKKSNYPSAPNPSAPYPSAPYPSAPYPSAPNPSAPYPSAPYPSAQYSSAPYPSAPYPSAPYPSAPYPSSSCGPCGYSQQYSQPIAYNGPQISYGQPSYGGYSAPAYVQPHRPSYGGRKKNPYGRSSQAYEVGQPYGYQSPQPVYQPPPSYQPPQPVYQPPQPTYQPPQPSYQPASAPVYSAPSQSYSYPSPAPSVPCGSNMLVGCHPHVSHVPCSGYSPSYGHPGYAPQPAPAYRAKEDESSVSMTPPASNSNQLTPTDKNSGKTNTLKEDPAVNVNEKTTYTETKSEGKITPQKDTVIVASQQGLSEDAQKNYEAALRLSKLSKDEKDDRKQNELPSPPSTTTIDQTHPVDSNTVPLTPLPGPQPTSMNMGMNQTPASQSHSQYFPQQHHPQQQQQQHHPQQQQQLHSQQQQQQPQLRWVN